jgi:transcriptional regulator with XRE-family HTH domain
MILENMAEIVSRTTIRDVARTAGVSVGSVSRALNGGKNVSAKVARDVAAAAEKLGYQPDFLARSLRTRSTGMVGCLVSDVANPLYASIVQAAEARLREAGLLLIVANTANDPARERAMIAAFRSRRLDGLLVAPGSDANDRGWRDMAAGGVPVVILDRDVPQGESVSLPGVLVDHREGARTATRYLIGLGHRRIALLTPGACARGGNGSRVSRRHSPKPISIPPERRFAFRNRRWISPRAMHSLYCARTVARRRSWHWAHASWRAPCVRRAISAFLCRGTFPYSPSATPIWPPCIRRRSRLCAGVWRMSDGPRRRCCFKG